MSLAKSVPVLKRRTRHLSKHISQLKYFSSVLQGCRERLSDRNTQAALCFLWHLFILYSSDFHMPFTVQRNIYSLISFILFFLTLHITIFLYNLLRTYLLTYSFHTNILQNIIFHPSSLLHNFLSSSLSQRAQRISTTQLLTNSICMHRIMYHFILFYHLH